KNRNPTDRHSRKSGNPKTQRNRNPSEKTETPPTVIPAKAGIQQPKNHRNLSAKTETPTASFPQKLESKNATQQEFIGKNRNPHRVIPAQAGIQTRRHGNLPDKTVSLDSTS
ncbi:TPA: hypothetical protein ACJKHO_002140, partial [Neisseria meningitidis]